MCRSEPSIVPASRHETADLDALRAEKKIRQERERQLRKRFVKLPEDQRRRIQQSAIESTDGDFMRHRIRSKGIADNVTTEVLEEFARLHHLEV